MLSLISKKEKRFAAVMLVSLLAIIAFSNTALSQTQTANLAAQIPFQGKLSDSDGKALTGNYNFKFEIYDSASAGAKLWSEEQIISVSGGRYQAYLGKISALTSSLAVDKILYLQIGVKTPAEANYKTLLPRISLSPSFAKVFSAGSADNSKSADSLSGNLDAAKISGQLLDMQIFNLSAGKIFGVLAANQIPSLDAGKIVSGVFDSARIPSLDAAKIVSGILDVARIPDLGAAKITGGVFDPARIPSLDVSKITGSFDSKLSYKISAGVSSVSDGATINFNTKSYGVSSFTGTPVVSCSSQYGFICAVTSASSTGFIVSIFDVDGTRATSPKSVNWIAIGS